MEASQDKIGNAVDAVLLYCYHYNPETGKYGAMVGNILRLAGAATILLIGGITFHLLATGSLGSQEDGEGGSEDKVCSIIFPYGRQQASTMASRVDALYIFLLIVTGMMALLVFVC